MRAERRECWTGAASGTELELREVPICLTRILAVGYESRSLDKEDSMKKTFVVPVLRSESTLGAITLGVQVTSTVPVN